MWRCGLHEVTEKKYGSAFSEVPAVVWSLERPIAKKEKIGRPENPDNR